MSQSWDAIKADNARILERIVARGTDPNRKHEMEFSSTFPNKAKALEARKELADLFSGQYERQVFIVGDFSKKNEPFDCILSFKAPLDLDFITEVEFVAAKVVAELQGNKISWGVMTGQERLN